MQISAENLIVSHPRSVGVSLLQRFIEETPSIHDRAALATNILAMEHPVFTLQDILGNTLYSH